MNNFDVNNSIDNNNTSIENQTDSLIDNESTSIVNENIDNSNNSNTLNNENVKNEYPEGFDATLYNLETKSLRTDKVRELINLKDAEIKDLTSQKENLRKIISKGKQTADLTQYQQYTPDSRFSEFYKDKTTQDFFNNFNQTAYNLGLNTEQHKAILDFFNNQLEKTGIVDTRTQAEKQLQQEDWRREEYKKLGDGAEYLIKKNLEFIDKYNFINEEQKESLKNFANSSASNLMIVQRFREVLDHNINEESPIPTVNVAGTGLADDRTLWIEFTNEKTPDIRKQQIIEERIKAGRPANWQV